MSAGVVFIGGISGVFLGMAVIYLSIRITAGVTGMLTQTSKENPK
ncbi:hypothetical protein [Desulfospira joergensenii]|nr:hypothetical protein [Desulfospira joergensenii]